MSKNPTWSPRYCRDGRSTFHSIISWNFSFCPPQTLTVKAGTGVKDVCESNVWDKNQFLNFLPLNNSYSCNNFFSCQAKTFQVIYYCYHFLFTPGTLNYCSTSAKSYIVLYLWKGFTKMFLPQRHPTDSCTSISFKNNVETIIISALECAMCDYV